MKNSKIFKNPFHILSLRILGCPKFFFEIESRPLLLLLLRSEDFTIAVKLNSTNGKSLRSSIFISRPILNEVAALVRKREGKKRGGYARVIRLPDKWDHVVAIVHAETLPLPPPPPSSVFSSYRPPSPIDHFPRPTPPFHAGANNFLFPKEFTELSYKILPRGGGSIFPSWEGRGGGRLHPFVSPLPPFFYFSINGKKRFFFCTIVRLSTGTILSISRGWREGGRRNNVTHVPRETRAFRYL